MANGSFDVGGLRGTYRITPLGEERFVTTTPDWEELSYHVQIGSGGPAVRCRSASGATLDEAVSNEAYTIDSIRVGSPRRSTPSPATACRAGVRPAVRRSLWSAAGRAIRPSCRRRKLRVRRSGAVDRLDRRERRDDADRVRRSQFAHDHGGGDGLTTVSTYNRAGRRSPATGRAAS